MRPSRCLTRRPPQYLKALHQFLTFVRRCQAPPERGQHCPRVRRRRIRHRSQRELALSLPAAEPIERLVAIRDDGIARSPSVMAQPPATSEIPGTPGGPRRHRHNRASIQRADHHRSRACTRQSLVCRARSVDLNRSAGWLRPTPHMSIRSPRATWFDQLHWGVRPQGGKRTGQIVGHCACVSVPPTGPSALPDH